MSFESEYPNLNTILGELFESAGDIKLALADGKVTAEELVEAIPDDAVRDYVLRLLKALQGLPAEVDKVVKGGPWAMMGFVQALISKITPLFK